MSVQKKCSGSAVACSSVSDCKPAQGGDAAEVGTKRCNAFSSLKPFSDRHSCLFQAPMPFSDRHSCFRQETVLKCAASASIPSSPILLPCRSRYFREVIPLMSAVKAAVPAYPMRTLSRSRLCRQVRWSSWSAWALKHRGQNRNTPYRGDVVMCGA